MALPVANTRFSPLAVKGMSDDPVWRPLSDHSVSPWRTMKTRGVDMVVGVDNVPRDDGLDGKIQVEKGGLLGGETDQGGTETTGRPS